MRAFLVASFCASGADLPFVRNHRIVPGREADSQCRGCQRSVSRSNHRVQTHVRLTPPAVRPRAMTRPRRRGTCVTLPERFAQSARLVGRRRRAQ
jgi:hypothetical protein